MGLYEFLQELDKEGRDSGEEGKHVTFFPVEEAEIVAVETETGLKFPPSFRTFLLTHGRFRVGDESSNVMIEIWEMLEDETSLFQQLQRDYDEESAEDIADAIDLDVDVIEATKHGLVGAIVGSEDYLVFDHRTTDAEGEQDFVMMELIDSDIEDFSHREASGIGFEETMMSVIRKQFD